MIKNKNRLTLFLLITVFLFSGSFAISEKTKKKADQDRLKFITMAKDQSYAYVLRLFPHPNSEIKWIWIVGIKELASGKIVSRQAAQTMRGQENELHLALRQEGSMVKIVFSIHPEKPRLYFRIQRNKRGKVVYRYTGEAQLKDVDK